MKTLAVLWGASALLACVDAPADPSAPDAGSDLASAPSLAAAQAHGVSCAGAGPATLAGTASRANDNGYPDQIDADVTWTLTSTVGCVDTYAPSGTITYAFAIPGAVCTQSIDPPSHAIAASDGRLTVDRATTPPTYAIHGATTWPITWSCVGSDGHTETQSLTGGGVWLDATALAGSFQRADQTSCGAPNGTPPCTYRWSLQ